jgi:phosphoribosylformylglycinamidine synthase
MVRLGTVVGPGEADAAVIRVLRPDGTWKGLGLVVDCNAGFCYLDPYEGARLAIAENARNLAVTGCKPLAVTDCLNFASPERPETMWQFAEAIRGIADACMALGTPVVSGNVSFYNETEGKGIHPTPMVAMVGEIADPSKAVTQNFKGEGDVVALLGRQTDELGGSEYLKVIHGQVAGKTPRLDIDLEKRVQGLCLELADKRLLRSAHDLSEGGLAVAAAECCVGGSVSIGAVLELPPASIPEIAQLFGEAPSRVLISFAPENQAAVVAAAMAADAELQILGRIGGRNLKLGGHVDVATEALSHAWRTGFATVLD